ncbi:biliverdin-producing heme oxygenase [Georgenia sp. SUBG003]|uniref:biliverdin-producing heme oxygenase n=1 Tax=Georgenia sp. SUBG003 TaxID=1497974 RepID=UPI003AB395AF
MSEQLREGTRAEHRAAESQAFVDKLLAGGLDVTAYADLAAQQLEIYSALEDVGDQIRRDPRVATLGFTELKRVPSIKRDLTHLYGPDWRAEIRILPATRTYAAPAPRRRRCRTSTSSPGRGPSSSAANATDFHRASRRARDLPGNRNPASG